MYRLIALKTMKSEIFKTGVALANSSGAMETDTISKHGIYISYLITRYIYKYYNFAITLRFLLLKTLTFFENF